MLVFLKIHHIATNYVDFKLFTDWSNVLNSLELSFFTMFHVAWVEVGGGWPNEERFPFLEWQSITDLSSSKSRFRDEYFNSATLYLQSHTSDSYSPSHHQYTYNVFNHTSLRQQWAWRKRSGATSFLHVILGLHSIHHIVASIIWNRKRGLQGDSLLCHLILAIDNSMLRSKTKPLFLKSYTVREFFNFLKSHEPSSRDNKIIPQLYKAWKSRTFPHCDMS